MPGCFVHTLPFFAPRDAMLIMLVCAIHWLSMHLYMLAYMFMHESCLLVCHLCFNTIKLWTFDLNLHLSLTNTTFCLPCCLFVFFLVSLLTCSFVYLFLSCLPSHALIAISILLVCFAPFAIIYASFPFHCLSIGFLSLPLHVHTWSEDAWS